MHLHAKLDARGLRTSMRVVAVKFVPFSCALVFFVPIEANLHRGRRAGPPQERGPRRRPEPRTITHSGACRSPTRAGGFVFAEPMAPAPLLSVPVAMPRTPETYS